MKFTLLTPAQQVADMEVTYVHVPGDAGDFGVLPGHMPLVSTLRSGGTVEATDTTGKTHTYTVSGGFAEVSASGVNVLAEAIG
ncbi:MAG: ATP synthase F1 subunit epsilon [Pseudomonadaceae bacterium]|nr:ATP synthase F1 subunit epsilon [Pseudomonadaceae bacterium]